MIIRLKADFEKLKNVSNTEDAKKILGFFNTAKEFNIPAYVHPVHSWVAFCKDYPTTSTPSMVDYFYGLNVESIEKHIRSEYGDSNADSFFVEASLLSMYTEKYYKFGNFIDMDGNDTENDFYSLDNYEELKDRAQFKNNWISVTIYKC